jgi:DNA-binding MarR family transcriptional regulator
MIEGFDILKINATIGAAERSMTERMWAAMNEVNHLRYDCNLGVEDIDVLHAALTLDRAGLIANHLRKAPPTISHVITRLTLHGFLARTQSAQDKRVWLLEVTPKGKELLEQFVHYLPPMRVPESTLGSAERLAKRVR